MVLVIDWAGWAVFGVIATAALTSVLVTAQMAGWTRLDLPLVLGTAFVADHDRARLVGVLAHLVFGQCFALGYAATFAAVGSSPVWLGALLGLLHGFVAVGLIVPLLPALHPRMLSERAGRSAGSRLEPPGALASNYGRETPAVTLLAHIVFGVALSLALTPT